MLPDNRARLRLYRVSTQPGQRKYKKMSLNEGMWAKERKREKKGGKEGKKEKIERRNQESKEKNFS